MLSPRPTIGEIADDLFPGSIREDACFVTVFTTYLDASRDDGDSNAHVLAGFISDKERWNAFDSEWQEVLDRYEVPVFHMTDFESGHGDFEGWEHDDPRRIPLLTALIDVINRNTVGSAGYGVSQLMYNALVPPEVNEYVGGSPYFLLFLGLVLGVENMMDNASKLAAGIPEDWQMIYILARGDKGSGKVLSEWMAKQSLPTRIETRTAGVYSSRENTYPSLQAADFLAFEGRKQVGLQLRQHRRGTRKSFIALEKSRLPRAWNFFEHEHHLRAIIESVQRAMRG